MTTTTRSKPSKGKPVEKIVGAERVLTVLKELADHAEGISLDELTMSLKASKSTVHRALATILKSGLATKTAHGKYILGDEFLRIANKFQMDRPVGQNLEPIMRKLAFTFGETVHYAVLDGVHVVYRAKTEAPEGSVKLSSVIGGRNPAHCTAVGKLLLGYKYKTYEEFKSWLLGADLARRTDRTITSPKKLWDAIVKSRLQGYAIDDQENEYGINCIAFPIFTGDPDIPDGAISISGLTFRMPITRLVMKRKEISKILDGLR